MTNDAQIKRVLNIAQAVLEDKTGIVEASQTLSALLQSNSELVSPEDFNLFRAIESETDDLPIGAVRDEWHPDSLAEKDREIARCEALWRDDVRAACKRILMLAKTKSIPAYDKTQAVDTLLPLSLEQQLQWMTSLGTYLTIYARDAYPFEESQGNITRLVGFNELLHQVFDRINTLNRGEKWTLESFLDVLQQKSILYGIEWDLNWAMENSFRGWTTRPGSRCNDFPLRASALLNAPVGVQGDKDAS